MCDEICNSRGLFILSFMIALILAPISAETKTDHPLKRLRTGKDIRWTFQFSGLPNDPQSVMIDHVENESEDDAMNEDSNNMIDDLVQSSRDDDMSMLVHSRTPTIVGNVSFEPSTISSFPMSPSTSQFPSTSKFPSINTPTAVHQPTLSPISLVPVTMPIATPIIEPVATPIIEPVATPVIEPVATPTFLSPVTNFPVILPTGPPLGSSMPSNLPTDINGIPSFSPTMICGKTAEQRRVEIVSQITEALDANAFVLLNATSPQSRALTWLLNERNETTCPGIKLLQRWVLATIYFSTGGDEWLKCSNRMGANDTCGSEAPFVDKKRFLSEDNECLWAGITCDMDKCVTAIEFESNNLIGSIPTEIGLLGSLELWGMEQGGLHGTIPTEISKLSNLYFLDLDFNDLSGSLPSELFSLPLIEQLDLNNNFITGNIELMGSLHRLEFMQLHNNYITGTLPSSIGLLSDLNTFTLHNTNVTGTVPPAICQLRSNGTLKTFVTDCLSPNPQIVCNCCSGCRRG